MNGPCLCGDPACARCFGMSTEPPEECPECGGANADEEGELLEDQFATCGSPACVDAAAAKASREMDAYAQELEEARALDDAEKRDGGG